ncbi:MULTISPECIES: hypothetical protein [Niastella]|uniref:Knr4/Smi1-like domain-containing protein n=1 Tax=Niastella soli TaxID=2821487 RepID=A0ABS3YSN6_9BACT|nr:hypothetical protein [Niastella soli]MBO9200216.1 hypothetical protein [Niastella soli]
MPGLDLTNLFEERAKLPKPTNENLRKLFEGIDRILIKDDGVYEEKAISDKVILEITGPGLVNRFSDLLEIDESLTGFYCLCLGSYAIELFANGQLRATIGFHHGRSIRYDKWNSDVALMQNENLLSFLAQLGLTGPQEEYQEDQRRAEASNIAQSEWLAIAPKCFTKFQEEIQDINLNTVDYLGELIAELDKEIPEKDKRVIALLQTYGKTSNFWTAYPIYEEAPANVLNTYNPRDILDIYERSDRNYKTRRGLGRYICSFNFRKIRKKYLKDISDDVINDLEKCFTAIGEEKGIYEINRLRKDKNKKNS